jgi:CRP-like cAMP-binding protein
MGTERGGSGGQSGRGARRAARVGSDLPVQLYADGLRGPLPARSREIGAAGICIATPSAFALKSVRRVVISLPSGPLSLEADGRWQLDAPADDVVLSGLEFVDPSPEAIEALDILVLETGRKLAQFLATESDLRTLGREEIVGLAHTTRFRDVTAGRRIYQQGTTRPGEDSIFVVGRGSVILQLRVREVTDVTLARLGPGRIFGGMPLVAEASHAETAIADTDTRLLEIDRDAYRYLVTARPALAQGLAFAVARAYGARLLDVLSRSARSDPDARRSTGT